MANATNVLTQGIEIKGSIKFSNDMIIDGKVDGEIISEKGKVTIAENANIKGDVKAGEVKLYGRVEGAIVSNRCELKEKSFLKGDIKTKTLSMEEGATLQGSTQIGGYPPLLLNILNTASNEAVLFCLGESCPDRFQVWPVREIVWHVS